MSEARAQLRFGDDALDGEISGGVVGPAATVGGTAAAARAAAAAAGGGSIGGSLAAGSLALGGEDAVGDFAPPAAPLQHSLATSLAHDPVRIRALHDAFFGGVGAGGAAAAALAGGGLAAGFLGMGGQGQGQGQLAAAASVVSMAGLGGREAPRGAAVSSGLTTVGATNWRRATPALTPGAPGGRCVVVRGLQHARQLKSLLPRSALSPLPTPCIHAGVAASSPLLSGAGQSAVRVVVTCALNSACPHYTPRARSFCGGPRRGLICRPGRRLRRPLGAAAGRGLAHQPGAGAASGGAPGRRHP